MYKIKHKVYNNLYLFELWLFNEESRGNQQSGRRSRLNTKYMDEIHYKGWMEAAQDFS